MRLLLTAAVVTLTAEAHKLRSGSAVCAQHWSPALRRWPLSGAPPTATSGRHCRRRPPPQTSKINRRRGGPADGRRVRGLAAARRRPEPCVSTALGRASMNGTAINHAPPGDSHHGHGAGRVVRVSQERRGDSLGNARSRDGITTQVEAIRSRGTGGSEGEILSTGGGGPGSSRAIGGGGVGQSLNTGSSRVK